MKNKIRKNQAFTLMEMLIAVAIVIILIAVGMPVVSTLNSKLKMKELDNYAKTLYLEAQNRLLEMKAEGSLAGFYEQVVDNYMGQNLKSAPHDYDVADGNSWGSLYYLDAGDLLSEDILPVGSSFDGSFIVELNPMTGDVYSVFYKEGTEALEYTEVKALSGRTLEERKTAGLGYYGGEIEVEEIAQEYITLDQRVSVVNAEELYLVISYKFSSVLSKNYTSDEFVIQAEVKGLQSGAIAELTVDKTNKKVVGNRMEVYVLLDSMLPGYSFKDITAGTALIPGENIEIRVQTLFNKGSYFQSEDESVTTNSLFSSKSDNSIAISNLRHLRNLDGSCYSHDTGAGALNITLTRGIDFSANSFDWELVSGKASYNQSAGRPASLATFVPLKNATVFESTEGANFIGNGNALTHFVIDNTDNSFADHVGFIQKISNMNVSGIDLVDVTVKGGNASYVGAFAGEIEKSTISECGVYLSTKNEVKTNYGEIAVDPDSGYANEMEKRYDTYTVSGAQFTGGFCGYAYETEFKECFTAVKVSGTYDVGGFCGKIKGNTGAGMLNCYASGKINATGRVGGIVGDSEKTAYKNCYSTSEIIATEYAGGFAGMTKECTYTGCNSYAKISDDITELSVPAYSGAFVGSANVDGDTFVNCSFLKQNGYNAGLEDVASVVSKAYGALKSPSPNPEQTHPYSAELIDDAFPFVMVTDSHYGDWMEQYTIDTSLAYYEVYQDGSYGYYTVTGISDREGEEAELTWVLNTLKDEICVEDGYALLTMFNLESFDYRLYIGSVDPSDANFSTNYQTGTLTIADEADYGTGKATLLRQQGALEFKGYEGNFNAETDFSALDVADSFSLYGMYLYQLPYELQTADRSYVEYFYDRFVIFNGKAKNNPDPVIGNATYDTTALTFYYCPHFARNAINPGIWNGIDKQKNPKMVYIRSAKQLNALGRYSYYWNTVGGHGYIDEATGNKMKINFVQETDISFSAYSKTYCGQSFDLMDTAESNPVRNRTIGKTLEATAEKQFNNNYNGSCKTIIDYRLETSERYAGLFGEVENGTIENVFMTVTAPYDPTVAYDPENNPESNKGGYIHSTYNGHVEESGGGGWWDILVGWLEDLFNALGYFDVEITAVGGLMGFSYHPNNLIQNCSVSGYEVKYIGSTSPDIQGICVGGLAGMSMSPITNCAATCDVRVEINGPYNKSICMGGLVGSAYYSIVQSSYSGGTIDISIYSNSAASKIPAMGVGGISGGVLKSWNKADSVGTVQDTTFKNVYSYTKIKVDRDVFDSVGDDIYWTNRIFGHETQSSGLYISPIAVKKVLYNSYTAGTKTFGPVIDAEDIVCDTTCMYLDYTSAGMEKYYESGCNEYTDIFGATLFTYDELANFPFAGMGLVDNALYTFPLAEALQGEDYDFRGAVKDADGNYVHYGDWPQIMAGITYAGEYLAYYEKYQDGSIGYYFIDENETIRDSLKNKAIAEAKYVLFKLLESEGAIPGTSAIELGGTYYFMHEVDNSALIPGSSANNVKYVWTYQKVRVSNADIAGGQTVSKDLYVNGNFGAAISLSNTLGKNSGNPYQIRTAAQMATMRNVSYSQAYFKQTNSINVSTLGDPITIRSNWTYDGGKSDGHKLTGAVNALFETNSGTITNVWNNGSKAYFIKTNNSSITDCLMENAEITASTDYAIFAMTNAGSMQGCYVKNCKLTAALNSVAGFVYNNDGSITDCGTYGEASYSGMAVIGRKAVGFVMSNEAGSTIARCFVAGTISGENSAAGFAAENKHTSSWGREYIAAIRNCYVNGNITSEKGSAYGFIENNDGEITSAYSTGAVRSGASSGAYVCGFGMNTRSSAAEMTNCYAVCTLQSVGAGVYGFAEPKDSGWLVFDSSSVSNCYWAPANSVTVSNGRGTKKTCAEIAGMSGLGDLQQADASAIPFNEELGTNYPYPEVTGLGHRGDWTTP